MERKIGLLMVIIFASCSAYPFDGKLAKGLEKMNSNLDSNELYFTQKLDHLDAENKDTWSQRYWHNNSSYKKSNGGVALLFIHNSYTISETDMIDEKLLNPMANDLHAARFYLEHRFYGKSKPKKDTSLESLRYLSSEQALADIAYFIQKINETFAYLAEDNVKWVIFGISYGGSLATWARFKYPSLIGYAVAINAPVLAKLDFEEYFQNVANSVNSYNSTCGERIASANKELKEFIQSGKNPENILDTFKLCYEITKTDEDVSTLFSELAQNFALTVDFSGIAIKSEKTVSIQKLCDIMLNTDATPLQSYAEVNRLNLRNILDFEQGCFDYQYNKMIERLKKTDYDVAMNDGRQWIYQACTEFGFFRTSSKTSDMFGDNFSATFFAKQCQDLFGPEFTLEKIKDNVSKTNQKYGGLEIEVNNTIFTYYSENPWRNLFITQNRTGFYEVIKVDGNLRQQKQVQSKIQPFKSFGNVVSDWWNSTKREIEKYGPCIFSGENICSSK